MRYSVFLLFSLFLCTCASAQKTTKVGTAAPVGIMDVATLDRLMIAVPGVGRHDGTEGISQSIKSFMMPVREVADSRLEWAYALTAALEFNQNLNKNYKDNYSPDYLVLALANSSPAAPNLQDGLHFLLAEGAVSASIVPYGSRTIPNAVYSVPKVKPQNFGVLFREATKARNRIFEIKKAVSRGYPAIIELRTPGGFRSLDGENYSPVGPALETHYLLITGYENGADLFELRGNFGRTWAAGGYVKMSYDDLAKYAAQGFVLLN